MATASTVLDYTTNKRSAALKRKRAIIVIAFIAVVALIITTTLTGIAHVRSKNAVARLEELQATIDEQEKTLGERQDTITSLENTINQLQEQIKKLQNAANTQTPPPTITYTGGVTYPTIDVSALAGKKLVALTFDDGPGPYTAQLLDILDAHQARATFFVLGSQVKKYPDLIKRMDEDNHAIGNHSYGHRNLTALSMAGINSEMGTTAELIKDITGHYPYIMRCPGGSSNANVRNYAKQIGVPIIYWSIDTRDWAAENKNPATVLANAKNGVKDGSIILMHDIHPTTVNAINQLILDLQADGYTLVTVPELLAARYGTIEPGKTYLNGHT